MLAEMERECNLRHYFRNDGCHTECGCELGGYTCSRVYVCAHTCVYACAHTCEGLTQVVALQSLPDF